MTALTGIHTVTPGPTDPRRRVLRPRLARGFTLIELMVVIGIAAVLVGLAAPSFQDSIANSRLKSHNSALQSSLLLARSEAIKRKTRVVMCKSANGTSCATTGNWEQGWIIFADVNDSATVEVGEDILLKVGALSGSFILKGAGDLASYVSFNSTGAAKLKASDASQLGVLTLCQVAGGNARQIEIFATGRLSVGTAPVASCTA